eukprot:5114954-Prymnesium_polylepis.1
MHRTAPPIRTSAQITKRMSGVKVSWRWLPREGGMRSRVRPSPTHTTPSPTSFSMATANGRPL